MAPSDDEYTLVDEEIMVTAPEGLDDAEQAAWRDGYQTAMALVAESAMTFHAALADDDHAPMQPAPADDADADEDAQTPPCPDCQQPTKPGMGGTFICVDCGVSLEPTTPPGSD